MRLGDIPRDLDWFKHNRMVANPKKFQVMFLGLKQHQEILLEIGNKTVNVIRSVKLLGIVIDDELKFDKHVERLCQQVGKKVNAFYRVAPFMNEKKRKNLNHTFIMSNSIIVQLSGCFAVKHKIKMLIEFTKEL